MILICRYNKIEALHTSKQAWDIQSTTMKSLIYIKLLKVGFTTSVSSVTVLYHCGFVNIYTQNQRDPIYIIIYNPINKINRSILNRDTVGFETMVYLLLFLIYCTPSACETIPRVNPFLYNQTYDLFVFMKDLLFHRFNQPCDPIELPNVFPEVHFH